MHYHDWTRAIRCLQATHTFCQLKGRCKCHFEHSQSAGGNIYPSLSLKERAWSLHGRSNKLLGRHLVQIGRIGVGELLPWLKEKKDRRSLLPETPTLASSALLPGVPGCPSRVGAGKMMVRRAR